MPVRARTCQGHLRGCYCEVLIWNFICISFRFGVAIVSLMSLFEVLFSIYKNFLDFLQFGLSL